MERTYQWVSFYEALADKLFEYEDKRDELFEQIKNTASEQPLMEYLHFENKEWWDAKNNHIDPFSIFAAFNRGITENNRTKIATLFASLFKIGIPSPTTFLGIPVLNNMRSFYSGDDDLWELFVQAITSEKNNKLSDSFSASFNNAVNTYGNGLSSITIGLYWIRPNFFMPLDDNSKKCVSRDYGLSAASVQGGAEYVEYLDALKTKMKDDEKGISLPELSYRAWADKAPATQSFVGSNTSTGEGATTFDGGTSRSAMPILQKNIILCGTPGTGKTYSTIQYAVAIVEEKSLAEIKTEDYGAVFSRYLQHKEDGLVAFTTFHQSFGYEEFIEGIRPVIVSEEEGEDSDTSREIKYRIHDGVFKDFCDRAVTPIGGEKVPNRVFIIDEINRGNISKIFGELITLIEPSKRIGAAEQSRTLLPYSGQNFGVPDNVYIIGTMNTADRSIALIDTALRRRFDFIEMLPDSSTLAGITVGNIDIATMLDTMNKRITILLDREHTIGHSYLLPLATDNSLAKLAEIFKNRIVPLLQEYFYDDYEKIRFVLGDNQKPDDNSRFIIKITDLVSPFGDADVDVSEYYETNEKAFGKVEAYAFLS
ncbi:MAG: AAA family ATPase [Coriobacteriales bacterium]|nr:AAA family ATPase [Coriobacteriales bacterium]